MNENYDPILKQIEQLQKVIAELIILAGPARTREFINLEMNLQGLNDPAVIREAAKIEEQINRMIGAK